MPLANADRERARRAQRIDARDRSGIRPTARRRRLRPRRPSRDGRPAATAGTSAGTKGRPSARRACRAPASSDVEQVALVQRFADELDVELLGHESGVLRFVEGRVVEPDRERLHAPAGARPPAVATHRRIDAAAKGRSRPARRRPAGLSPPGRGPDQSSAASVAIVLARVRARAAGPASNARGAPRRRHARPACDRAAACARPGRSCRADGRSRRRRTKPARRG